MTKPGIDHAVMKEMAERWVKEGPTGGGIDGLARAYIELTERVELLERVREAAEGYKTFDDLRWETGEHQPQLHDLWINLGRALSALKEAP